MTSTAVIGGGIIGLAVARQLLIADPERNVTVLEKERSVAQHQTGHNSGVVHAGLYYLPGSLKSQLCSSGRRLLLDFCAEHDISTNACGKVVVATTSDEQVRLQTLFHRALEAKIPGVRLISSVELHELEPHVVGLSAIHSPTSAIVDFGAVARTLAGEIRSRGGQIHCGFEVTDLANDRAGVRVGSRSESLKFDNAVACAGLHADRLAVLAGDEAEPQIVAFRGEYLSLAPERCDLVNGLVYPVPDPRDPFLGVHLTRRIGGGVDVGPNAVLAGAREGYRRRDMDFREIARLARSSAFRAFARTHWRTGLYETSGSLSRRVFISRVQRYVPELTMNDVVAGPAGVRAQALDRDGSLVDDFRISQVGSVVIVRNAPSPAATSSFAIARHIATQLEAFEAA